MDEVFEHSHGFNSKDLRRFVEIKIGNGTWRGQI